jgi:ketosteroid isomerase-like protein
MTGENMELARRAADAFAGRDVETMRECVHPDGQLQSMFSGPQGRVYHGPDDVARYVEDIDAAFDNWRAESLAIHEGEGDRLVLLYRATGVGKGSHIPVDLPVAMVWDVKDGKLWRGRVYLDQKAALAEAGLDPGLAEGG